MIFSELYGAYYNTVASVLKHAVKSPVTPEIMRDLIAENAFGESLLNLEPALSQGRWQLLLPDGTTPLEHIPSMPLTHLQKRWLKAISLDPRVRLFPVQLPEFPDVDPLFTPADYTVFDKFADGDPYEDEEYIKRFRTILQAIHEGTPLRIDMRNRSGGITDLVMLPKYLEYSEKDDKFRVFGIGSRFGSVINLGRIIKCKPYTKPFEKDAEDEFGPSTDEVIFEIVNERNAPERALLHFAHFEKEAEKSDERHFRLTVRYRKADETEMVIRALSFGPMLRVVGPPYFEKLIKERLIMQKNCGLS